VRREISTRVWNLRARGARALFDRQSFRVLSPPPGWSRACRRRRGLGVIAVRLHATPTTPTTTLAHFVTDSSCSASRFEVGSFGSCGFAEIGVSWCEVRVTDGNFLVLRNSFETAVCVPKALGDGDYEGALKGPTSPFQPYKLVKVELDGTRRPLTAQELNALEKTHADVCEWTTPLSQGRRKWQKSCAAILKKLLSMKKQAWPFIEPVDWETLNIPDYPVIIKHPMDLKTIESKLNDGLIESPDEFVALVRTVFRNSYVYNPPGDPSGVRECAEKLSGAFEKELAKL
jgi:hypothetical protein